MAEYRYYLIPDAMTRAFPEQFGKQTPTEQGGVRNDRLYWKL